ncbi:MAG: hypothetical protein ACJ73N_13190 [Bryobacteraceae bacterium]
MAFTTVPSAAQTISELGATLELIHAALEHGVTKAKYHFRRAGIGIDQEKQAFSSLVRLHAKQFLKKRNLESAELEQANLCGIWLRTGPYHLKVWRISDEDLEKAQTPASDLFEQFQFVQDGEPISLTQLRIYWQLADSGRLSLYLAYPKYEDPKSTECFWLAPVLKSLTQTQLWQKPL